MKHRVGVAIISFFFDAPDRVPAELRSFHSAVVIGGLFAISYHIGLIVFWQVSGVTEMVAYHLIGFPLLLGGLVLAKSGRPVFGTLLITIEYILHAYLGTYFLGWDSGMHFPIPLAALVWTIIPVRKHYLYRFAAAAFILLYILLIYLSPMWSPVFHLPAATLRWTSVAMSASFLCLAVTFMAFNSVATGWWESLEYEREKSEHLLLNVLPEKIAHRLKEREEIIADRFDSASVLFFDIVGFTTMSASLPANEVVSILNDLFCRFDTLADSHGLEKIKTIGDAYMAVSGIPDPVPDHAHAAAEMAIDMLDILDDYSQSAGRPVQARIGICSGPVVAGVIGRRKFIYDLWGDTVNTASRMESHGIPNRIQVTPSTYELLREDFTFESRGTIEIKGKGSMQTYFLDVVSEESPNRKPGNRNA